MVSSEILLNLVSQLPPCVQKLHLSFQTRAPHVASAATLLSTADWVAMAADCGHLVELSTIEIEVQLEYGGKVPTIAQKAAVHSEIDAAFNDGRGMYRLHVSDAMLTTFADPKLDVVVQWERRVPQAITYDSDFEA